MGVNIIAKTHQGIVVIYPPNEPEGTIAFPGGHVEYGESPEEAAIREVFEETSLHIRICRCLGWYFIKSKLYPGPMLSFMYEGEMLGGKVRASDEGKVGIFPLEKLPPISTNRTGSIRLLDTYFTLIEQESNK